MEDNTDSSQSSDSLSSSSSDEQPSSGRTKDTKTSSGGAGKKTIVRGICSNSRVYVMWLVVVGLLVLDLSYHRLPSSYQKPSALSSTRASAKCSPNAVYKYSDKVDLRIIVITYNRNASMLKLLKSLNNLILDGDTAALEVWIDRSKQGHVDSKTLNAVQNFKWTKGVKRVHVQDKHVGIYGQWIDTWRPNGTELALILEDDISVSPYAWRWIKAVHRKFGGRDDILGYTLQSHGVNFAIGGGSPKVDPKVNVFLNRQMGSWGFAPHPKVWAEFQDWFHKVSKDLSFKPYIGGGVVFDSWYKAYEKIGAADTMWTEWFIHYTNKHNLYCVYSNIEKFTNSQNHKIGVHRAEPGLHHSGQARNNEHELLSEWQDEYVQFPAQVPRYEFDGTVTWVVA